MEHKQCPACAAKEIELKEELEKWKKAFKLYVKDNWVLEDSVLTDSRIDFICNHYLDYASHT